MTIVEAKKKERRQGKGNKDELTGAGIMNRDKNRSVIRRKNRYIDNFEFWKIYVINSLENNAVRGPFCSLGRMKGKTQGILALGSIYTSR